MSNTASCDRDSTISSHGHSSNVNAGIDSSFSRNPNHRGSLTPSELDSIHQTNSFKQAVQLQDEDNRDLAAKMKKLQRITETNK